MNDRSALTDELKLGEDNTATVCLCACDRNVSKNIGCERANAPNELHRGNSGRMELTLTMVSFHYANPSQACSFISYGLSHTARGSEIVLLL